MVTVLLTNVKIANLKNSGTLNPCSDMLTFYAASPTTQKKKTCTIPLDTSSFKCTSAFNAFSVYYYTLLISETGLQTCSSQFLLHMGQEELLIFILKYLHPCIHEYPLYQEIECLIEQHPFQICS
jgi:hypothetical protein